jgi:glyoxylase-like metal-dependent hydrolase (beta-lactamase superfamily II)
MSAQDQAATITQIAPGVTQVSVGVPFRSHVYVIDGMNGTVAFDAAIKGSGQLIPRLHAAWDGGTVKIAGTVADGDQVAGFDVIHIPGHAPGQIALFRKADRLLIAADAIYTLDAETGQPVSARVPHPFSNIDLARESIRRLIPLQASSVWAGHAQALTGENVAEELRRAADYGLDCASG